MKTEDSAECHQTTQCAGQSGNETTRRAAHELLIYAYYNKSVWALMCMATVRVQRAS